MKCNLAKFIFIALLLILVFSLIGCADSTPGSGSVLILYAFADEGRLLTEQTTISSSSEILGRTVVFGTLEGKEVIIAESGVGMTNAAMMTQTLIDHFEPRIAVFTGIAGAIDSSVQIGDIFVADLWATHDYGYVGQDGFGPTLITAYDAGRDSLVREEVWEVDSALFAMAQNLTDHSFGFEKIGERRPELIVGGVGVSGNQFIDSREKRIWLAEEFCAMTTDMESAAVAQVCIANHVPYIVFRSASDLAGGSGSETARDQMDRFFQVAANNSSLVVRELIGRL